MKIWIIIEFEYEGIKYAQKVDCNISDAIAMSKELIERCKLTLDKLKYE